MNEQSPAIACLCFSKDRPIQLEGYIKSLQRFASEKIPITVIYCASNEKFLAAYDKLSESMPEVEFILEKNFRRHVTKWIRSNETPYFLFGVDDWIFRKDIDVSIIKETLENPDIYSFSLRLGLEITYSGMLQKAIPRPHFLKKNPCLIWDWDEDHDGIDWSYPFEICATIFRRESLIRILAMIETGKIKHPHWPNLTSDNWGHPNKFEAFASMAVRHYDKECPKLMASFPEAKGSLVTVNRVQDECENFVYDETHEMGTEDLLELWDKGYEVDIDSFAQKTYSTIHMGDFFLKPKGNANLPPLKFKYDFNEVMLQDLLEPLKKKGNPILNEPVFINFQKIYREYFSKPEAETLGIRISPILLKENTDKYRFYQNHWFMERIKNVSAEKILDIGTNLELIGAASAVIPGTSIQPFQEDLHIDSLEIKDCALSNANIQDKSQSLTTSLSFIETVGMGQYGEELDPLAGIKLLKEINRIIAPGGSFIGSMAIGRDSFIDFNKRRGIEKKEALKIFPDFEIISEQFLYPEPGPEDNIQKMHDFKYCLWCFELKRK